MGSSASHGVSRGTGKAGRFQLASFTCLAGGAGLPMSPSAAIGWRFVPHEPLRVAVWAPSQHGDLRAVTLLTWQLDLKSIKAEASRPSQGLGLELAQYYTAVCWVKWSESQPIVKERRGLCKDVNTWRCGYFPPRPWETFTMSSF